MIPKQKNIFSLKARIGSFRFAFRGILYALRTQHNLWIHLCTAVLAVVMGIVLRISITEWLFVCFAIGFVLAAEIVNTAIEKLVDLVSPDWKESAGRIKDLAAGFVLIAAITALIAGAVIFLPKILLCCGI
jgi:diacylglycerol kinase (ATP)